MYPWKPNCKVLRESEKLCKPKEPWESHTHLRGEGLVGIYIIYTHVPGYRQSLYDHSRGGSRILRREVWITISMCVMQQAVIIIAQEAQSLGKSGGMLPRRIFGILAFLECIWCILMGKHCTAMVYIVCSLV